MSDSETCAAKALEATGNFKVLRRFAPPDLYAPLGVVDEATLKVIMAVDTETTGLDKAKDKIIELAYVLARFNPATGRIHDIISRYNGMQDPGMPLPEHITKITGITDADVAGQSLDRARILADMAKVDLIIAHNAPFDRGFIEVEFPEAAGKWWACSNREGPWEAMLAGSTKLEFLAYKIGGIFYDAHRALTDAEVLLHLLTLPAHDDQPILKHVLDRSRQLTYRIWATAAPYDKKDALKIDRGFKWNDGTDPDRPIKAWFKEGIVGADCLEAALADLGEHIYDGRGYVTVDEITGRERFTDRVRARNTVGINQPSEI